MIDRIEKIGKSTVHHGPNSDRIYLMKLHKDDSDQIIDTLESLAIKSNYSKIFAKVPSWAKAAFLDNGYKAEARIPHFYNGTDAALFFGKFYSANRSFVSPQMQDLIEDVKSISLEIGDDHPDPLPDDISIRILGNNNIEALTALYAQVFTVYPFPIFEQDYIKKTMKEDVVYFGAFKGKELIAASSAEMDIEASNVEMTDFATSPNALGNNLSYHLLRQMEIEMATRNIKTAYTIARAVSFGMNKTFGRCGYSFGGTLINNTNIGTTIECMNVWFKKLTLDG